MRRTIGIKFLIFLIVIFLLSVVLCLYFRNVIQIEDTVVTGAPGTEKPEIAKAFNFSQDKSLDEWDEKKLYKNATKYTLTESAGKKCVKAESDNSASALFYRIELSYKNNPFVSWRWKTGKFPDLKHAESLSKKKEFDFIGQVYIIFYSRFFLKAKAIQYVWTKEIPVGTVSPSPYTNNVKLLVLESGASDEWKFEKRNIREDFKNLFGQDLDKDVAAVSFMTDADSTDSTAEAFFTDITLGYLAEIKEPGISEPPKKDYTFSGRIRYMKDYIIKIVKGKIKL